MLWRNWNSYWFARLARIGVVLSVVLLTLVWSSSSSSVMAETLPDVTTRAALAGTQAAAQSSITGWLTILWGDSGPGIDPVSPIHYYVTSGDGTKTELVLNEETARLAGTLLQLNRQRVTVTGMLVQNASGSTAQGMRVRTVESAASQNRSQVPEISGAQPWISIACKFSDVSAEPKNLAYFQGMYSSSYPGLDHYWREVSYNNVNVSGSNAVGWYTLPHTRSYYIPSGGSANLDALFADCTALADSAVNFANFTGINLMFNDWLDCCAWGGGRYATLDGVSKIWNTTWEPPWGYSDITVMSHEMGHGFGMPHSSGNYGQTYDNRWDVMSDTWTDCARLTDATYGCLGQNTISYHLDISGWIAAGRKFTASGGAQNITLERTDQPQTSNYLMAQIPIAGSSTHFYTVEARKWNGYDVKLPGEAVIIHEVDTTRGNPARVVDTDNNGDTGDAGAMWTVGETFTDATNSISVVVNSATATGWNVTINSSGSVCTPNVAVTSYPSTIAAGGTVGIGWSIGGSGCTSVDHTNVHWDTVSHAGSNQDAYANIGNIYSGGLGAYSDSFTAPTSGSIYFLIHAIVDGVELITGEYAIAIQNNGCVPLSAPVSSAIPASGEWVKRSVSIDDAPLDATITNLRVKVDLDHPRPDMLELALLHVNSGQELGLGKIESAGGKVKLERQDLTAFNGQSANGEWMLRVRDTGSGESGQLNSFAVRPEYPYNGPTLRLESEGNDAKPLALRLSDNLKQGKPAKEKKPKPAEGSPEITNVPDGTWELLKYETFEGAFPDTGWSVFGGTTGGLQMYWDDDDARPHAGYWAGWPANGGANGVDPAVYCYPNGLSTWMIYGPFDLTNTDDAATLFDLWRSIETGWDYVYFGVSGDGTNFYGYYWDGQVDWQTQQIYYGNYAGDSSVWVGWYFYSDGSIAYPGPWVDEIAIWKSTNIPPQVFVDRVWTTNNKGAYKTKFKRGAKIQYHAAIRNPGSATCTVYSIWKAKGGRKTIMSWSGNLDIAPGTWDYRLATIIPTTAAVRSYVLSVSTNCGGQYSTASSTFYVTSATLKGATDQGEYGPPVAGK